MTTKRIPSLKIAWPWRQRRRRNTRQEKGMALVAEAEEELAGKTEQRASTGPQIYRDKMLQR